MIPSCSPAAPLPARSAAPLIVSAIFGAADFAWLDGQRRTHFPSERNVIRAHLTLFHHLPPARADELMRHIEARVRGCPPPAARITGLMSLGRGVAYRVESTGLVQLRNDIADAFAADLIPQDRQTPRLHVTIQNKVAPPVAAELIALLSAGFAPRPLAIAGIGIWHYRDGPWESAGSVPFRGARIDPAVFTPPPA